MSDRQKERAVELLDRALLDLRGAMAELEDLEQGDVYLDDTYQRMRWALEGLTTAKKELGQ